MKKKPSSEMPIVGQEQFPSGNPDLGMTNAIPRSTEFDLNPTFNGSRYSHEGEFTFKSPKTGNQARKDGKA